MSSVPAMRVWQARRDLEPTPTMLSSFSFSSGLIRDRFLRPDGDAIGDRRTQQLLHRADFEHVASRQLFSTSRSNSPWRYQKATDVPRQHLCKAGQLGAGWGPHPTKPQRAVGTLDVHPVEEEHVEVDVEVQRAAEALDQGDRAGLGRLTRKARLLDQVRGYAAIDDAEHPAQ